MIQKDLPYNPKKDIKPVSQEGWLDLKKAYANGVVPGDLDIDEASYNDIDNPSHVGSMPRDPFQAQRLKAAAAAVVKAQAAAADTPPSGSEAK